MAHALPEIFQNRIAAVTRCMLLLALLGSCSKNPASNDSNTNPPTSNPPADYPDIPRPASPQNPDVPTTSDTFTTIFPIAGKNVDFVPVINNGTFTWDVDIQTQYDQHCFLGCPPGVTVLHVSDPPGDYYNGTRRFSTMVFEGGIVNLTTLNSFQEASNSNTGTQRLVFIENGETVQPRSPYRNDCWFDWRGNSADKRVTPCLFGGYVTLSVATSFPDIAKWRKYYVAAKSCNTLNNPVYVRRDRFWELVEIDGKRSILVDPGTRFSVSYTTSRGVSVTESEEFARALDVDLGIEYSAITTSIGTTLTETVSSQVEVSEQVSVTVEREVTGKDNKTIIFSVWRSVELFTIVDSLGSPYTDPDFSFTDLGYTRIVGDHEWHSSTEFPK